ncbi:glycosyltransferase family 2 protein [Alicyclobacillus curvatus]|nr:glycosyltransferase family 2 protein [Alicyclobacillus curvatus]
MKISVAIPTHERARYLKSCLESVLNQTLLPDEIIVSEDGEDPETLEVISRLLHRGTTIRHIRNAVPLLQLANRQQALQMTSGDYVAMLDDDDQWEPTFLERTSAVLSRHQECGFCTTDHFIMDDRGDILSPETEQASKRFGRTLMRSGVYDDVLLRVLDTCPFSLQHTLFRRDILQRVGFLQTYGKYVPDFVLFATLGAHRVKAYYIAERLGRYRVHGGQQTVNRIENSDSKLESLEMLHRGYSAVLSEDERQALEKLYIAQIIEVAVARAHLPDRWGAINVLGKIFRFGFGFPPIKRLLALGAVLTGVAR